jgi:hypothetical protein
VTTLYHLLRHLENLNILTQCVYVFHMNLTVNGDYFPKQHWVFREMATGFVLRGVGTAFLYIG